MRNLFVTILACLSFAAYAQNSLIKSDRIASLQVMKNNDWQDIPVIKLGGHDVINISFDDLTHDYTRYTYNLTHCEADWSPSDGLFQSDYIRGYVNDNTIDDYEESINTNMLYLHYQLRIPNQNCQITMSGNYRLDVIDDDTRDTVLTACFMVYEPIAAVNSIVDTNTDIDIRREHQQLSIEVKYPSTLAVTDPRRQVKVAVVKNAAFDDITWCPQAPIIRPNTLEWTHTKELIFPAGNEYHKFEILDPHRNSLGVDKVVWDGEWYNVHVFHDYPRRAYVYDEDANGSYIIRNTDNYENNTTSEYVMAHFYLDTPVLDGDVYINGRWTNNIPENYKMEYDYDQKCYHIALPLKLGYYNYQYLLKSDDNSYGSSSSSSNKAVKPSYTKLTEGDFYQTENKYNVLVYFRADHERTWRLVGVGESGMK